MTGGQLLLRHLPKAASFAMATAGVASLNEYSKRISTKTFCESEASSQKKKDTLQSPTLLVALTGQPFGKKDFENLWNKREMDTRHPEFKGTQTQVKETAFPTIYNLDLQERIQSLLQVPEKVQNLLWQVETSAGGPLGQSGAIPKDRAAEMTMNAAEARKPAPTESLILFRGHPEVADGISLAEAFMDLCDEAAELKHERMQESRNKKALTWWQKLARLLQSIYNYSIGSLKAFLQFWNLYMTTSENPFQHMESLMDGTKENERPNLSWAQLGTVQEVKQVAQSLKKQQKDVTLNDVIVSCVTAAVARQIQEHQMDFEMDDTKKKNIPIPSSINVMVEGREGPTVTGAVFAPVPSDITSTAAQRLEQVRRSLSEAQQTTLHFWSNLRARVVSTYSSNSTAPLQPNVAFLVTSTQAPQRHIHLAGRQVEVFQGFTPLPEGVPIGVFVSTYAGKLSISVTAAPWAVPDAEKFLSWVQDEYKFLYTESPVALENN